MLEITQTETFLNRISQLIALVVQTMTHFLRV